MSTHGTRHVAWHTGQDAVCRIAGLTKPHAIWQHKRLGAPARAFLQASFPTGLEFAKVVRCHQSLHLVQFMSSQSGYHTTEDDASEPPTVDSPSSTPTTEQPNDASTLRGQLQNLTVSSQSEIAYWKAQVDQSKQDMVEILGHAENLSQACEQLEDENEGLKAENIRLKSELAVASSTPDANSGRHATSTDVKSRLAVALDGDDDPSLLNLLENGGMAEQLSAVAQRLRSETQRTEEASVGDEADDVSRYITDQLGLLGMLLEGAAQKMLEQATELATEKEAHDVTASRLALVQKKHAVQEMKNSVRGVASTSGAGSPVSSGSPGTPRSVSRPSRRPRSMQREVSLSPNGSNWDQTLRESLSADADTAVTIDHSRPNSSRRASTSNGRQRPAEYPSVAPPPVRRRERMSQRSHSRPRAGSSPSRHFAATATATTNRTARATSAPRKRHGGRSSSTANSAHTSLGYRRTTAASLSHEPAAVGSTVLLHSVAVTKPRLQIQHWDKDRVHHAHLP